MQACASMHALAGGRLHACVANCGCIHAWVDVCMHTAAVCVHEGARAPADPQRMKPGRGKMPQRMQPKRSQAECLWCQLGVWLFTPGSTYKCICLLPLPPACRCSHVMLQGKGVLDTQMPALPESVHAVPHVNECYDWGTFGWVGAGCGVQDAGCRGRARGRAIRDFDCNAPPVSVVFSWPCPLSCLPPDHFVAFLVAFCGPCRPLRPSSWTPPDTDMSSSSTPACGAPSCPPTGR